MVRPLEKPFAAAASRRVSRRDSRAARGDSRAAHLVALSAVARGPVRVFVGELPVGRARAAVLTLASARDPVPDGGRITACIEGHRVPVGYRRGETARAVCHRLALAVERRLGSDFAVRFEAPEGGVACLHVARAIARAETTTVETALDRLASLLGTIAGIAGVGATRRSLVVYAQSEEAVTEVRAKLPELRFLRWPVAVALCD